MGRSTQEVVSIALRRKASPDSRFSTLFLPSAPPAAALLSSKLLFPALGLQRGIPEQFFPFFSLNLVPRKQGRSGPGFGRRLLQPLQEGIPALFDFAPTVKPCGGNLAITCPAFAHTGRMPLRSQPHERGVPQVIQADGVSAGTGFDLRLCLAQRSHQANENTL